MPILMWFRNDLRVHDNRALDNAAKSGQEIIAVFCYTPKQWLAHDLGANKVAFLHAHVAALQEQLARKNIPLLLPVVSDYAASVKKICSIAKRLQCSAVHWNVEYEINERERDKECAAQLEKMNISVQRYTDQSIVHPADIQTGSGSYYKVFTPFKRAWIQHCQEHDLPQQVVPVIKKQTTSNIPSDDLPQRLSGYQLNTAVLAHWSIGEPAAHQQLERFIQESAPAYKQQRDLPSLNGTSNLSAYVSIGVLSPRHCLRLALQANGASFSGLDAHGKDGLSTWISELIWREYYRHVIFGFPHVCRGHAFKRATDKIRWSDNQEHFQAWCEARTGIPIVDAGMRQLLQTGWMHNRVRMIVAMFLSKNLFLNWRWGERFFNQHLCDADFASNNGGWQWSASTGTDAAPYFRIFNPYSQSQRFDPDAHYIKQWLPELTSVPAGLLHDPLKWKPADRALIGYPQAIVDCKHTRQAAIEAFKNIAQ